jgi:GDP/UDP-N,N'-diacetylbacillosamine 2-epimerase (hydrolysing)
MKIAFITGSRSEWGYIRPILRHIEQDQELDYALIVTNMHLLPRFGSTIREIEHDGFRIAERIFMAYDGFTGLTMTKSLASLLSELPAALERASPHLLLLAGDRGEQLMGAIAAVHMRIAVAHVQAGELSGHVDGVIRHAITKLAHIHFAANEECAERVRGLGEQEFRIHVTGAPLVDELVEGMYDSPSQLADSLGIVPDRPLILAVQHPVIEDENAAGRQLDETIAALAEIGAQTVFIAPNSDAGSHAIREHLARLRTRHIRVIQNLPRSQFLGLLKLAAAIVGNSSSGILEAPTFGTPCVNIGGRQRGRLQTGHVINVDHCRHSITRAIRTALSPAFAAQASRVRNPYGNGGAAERIVKIVKDMEFNDRLLNKELTF